MDLRLYEAEQRAKDKSLARKIFIVCVILIFLTAATCEAQQQIPRQKTGDYWHALSLRSFTSEGDTIVFGSVYYPTPYQFLEMSITTTGRDKCVRRLTVVVNYKDGTTDYLSSYNDFNCQGVSFVKVNQYEAQHLRDKEIKNMAITNNDNHHSFTVDEFDSFQYYKIALNN